VCKSEASGGSIYSADDDYNEIETEDFSSLISYEKDFPDKVECNYETSNSYEDYGQVYVCYLLNKLNITSKNAATLIKADGRHSVLKTDNDVTAFRSDEAYHMIHYFPRNLENIFPNLTIIFINNGRLKEIHQSDLKPFQKLTYLDLDQNDIEILEDGLFYYNTKLTLIRLERNLIIHIGIQVFDNLNKVKSLCLHNNPCINMEAKNNATEVMRIIKTTQQTCLNSDYETVDNNLKIIEDTLVCINSETFPIFERKFQNLESEVKKSKFSLSKVLKNRFDVVNEFKSQNHWTTKDKLEKVGKSVLDSELEVTNKIKVIKNELQIDNKRVENAINDKIQSLERTVYSKINYLMDEVNINIRNQSNVVTSKINDINSNIGHMHEINTKNIENFTKESINILKNDINYVKNQILNQNERIQSKQMNLERLVNESIINLGNDIKSMMNMKISAMEFMIQNKTDQIKRFTNDSIKTVKSKVANFETSVTNSRSDIINNIKNLKNDLTVAQNIQILKLSEKIEAKQMNLERMVNESIRSLANDFTSMMNMKISAMELIVHSKSDNMQQSSNDSIKTLEKDLTTKISTINDRMSTIESSILHLSSIMQKYINVNTISSSQFQSELKDRLQITNYKIDKNSMIQDYSKSMLIGSCALLITLVLVIMYKKILTRTDDMDY